MLFNLILIVKKRHPIERFEEVSRLIFLTMCVIATPSNSFDNKLAHVEFVCSKLLVHRLGLVALVVVCISHWVLGYTPRSGSKFGMLGKL